MSDRGFSFQLKIDYVDDPEYPLVKMNYDELTELRKASHNRPGPIWKASVSSVKNPEGKELLNEFILEWDKDKAHGGLQRLLDELKIMLPRVLKANGLNDK